jgi:hypothetical protein
MEWPLRHIALPSRPAGCSLQTQTSMTFTSMGPIGSCRQNMRYQNETINRRTGCLLLHWRAWCRGYFIGTSACIRRSIRPVTSSSQGENFGNSQRPSLLIFLSLRRIHLKGRVIIADRRVVWVGSTWARLFFRVIDRLPERV